MEELFSLVAKTYGLVGLLIFAPFVATGFLWRANNALQAGAAAAQASRVEDQKARVEDQNKRVEDMAGMMQKLLEVVRDQTQQGVEMNGVLERLSVSVDKLERHALTNGRPRER